MFLFKEEILLVDQIKLFKYKILILLSKGMPVETNKEAVAARDWAGLVSIYPTPAWAPGSPGRTHRGAHGHFTWIVDNVLYVFIR